MGKYLIVCAFNVNSNDPVQRLYGDQHYMYQCWMSSRLGKQGDIMVYFNHVSDLPFGKVYAQQWATLTTYGKRKMNQSKSIS